MFKGSFTLKQALETITFINEYEKDLKRYLLLYKRYCVRQNTVITKEVIIELIRKIYKLESSVSEEVFKVPRQVMTFNRRSRLDLINEVTPRIQNLFKDIDLSTPSTVEDFDNNDGEGFYNYYVNM